MALINRKTRQFSDINLLFTINPMTADLTRKTDEEAIKASVRNLISTKNYERPFHPEIGCQIFALLFENFTPVTKQLLQRTISETIEKFEPRVKLLNVRVKESQDVNTLSIEIVFKILNTEKPITLNTNISRVR